VFPVRNRLRSEKDIKALFAKGRSVFDFTVGMRFRKTDLPISRITVVVGTKVSKRAVVRNRLKRRIRGILEKQIPVIPPGFDMLILVKKESIDQTTAELEAQLMRIAKKAKIL